MSQVTRSRISTTLVVLAALVSVTFAVMVTVLKIGFTPLLSDSMSPHYPAGSVAITQQKDTARIVPGDVVKLPLPHTTADYIHRVATTEFGEQGLMVTTKGDNNPAVDNWTLEITSSQTPVMVGAIPLVGYVNVFTGNFWAQMTLVGLVLALLGVAAFRATRP